MEKTYVTGVTPVEQVEQFSPDVSALNALDAALMGRDNFNRLIQRRRFLANQLRAKANHLDAETNLMVEEYREIEPIPEDYEPVEPLDEKKKRK